MGHNINKLAFLAIRGVPINNQTGPILLPSYPLTYIYLHINTDKIWKQSDKDFLSYCENNEVSADAAA